MILAFYVVACVLFAVAASGINTGQVGVGWLGLFFATLPQIWDKL